MKKMKRILFCVALLAMVLLCTACGGTKQMPDNLLKTAVRNADGSYDAYGLQITNLHVDDRNCDGKYKTETITVSVTAENDDSTYQASYRITAHYGDRDWTVTDSVQSRADAYPKQPLSNDVVDEVATQLVQRLGEQKYYVSYTGWDSTLDNLVYVDISLTSYTPYIDSIVDYKNIPFAYSLSGWTVNAALDTLPCERTVQLNSDLCGTWSYTDESGNKYGFVIDGVDGVTVSIKCYTDSNDDGWRASAIRQLSNEPAVQVTLEEREESQYCLTGTVAETTVYKDERETVFGQGTRMVTMHSDYTVDFDFYPQRNGGFSHAQIYGDEYLKNTSGTCIMMRISAGESKTFDRGYVLTKQ